MTQAVIAEAWPERYLTLEEWAELPIEDAGEYVDGRIVEDEEVGFVHDVVAAWVVFVLRGWLAPRGGFVAVSDCRLVVMPTRGRRPDICAYFPGSRKPPGEGLIRTPPDIAVEVVSSRPRDERRDRIDKVKEYAAFGVRWYWIVHPQARTFEILELGADGRYLVALSAAEGVVTTVAGCEGLSVDLDDLWKEVDHLQRGGSADPVLKAGSEVPENKA